MMVAPLRFESECCLFSGARKAVYRDGKLQNKERGSHREEKDVYFFFVFAPHVWRGDKKKSGRLMKIKAELCNYWM